MSDIIKHFDSHNVIDSDITFIVDPFTRAITSENPQKYVIMRGDHNSERFTFKIPRYIEGHDMYLCNHVAVPYLNFEGKKKGQIYATGVYLSTDIHVDPEDPNMLVFSWLISSNATKFAGSLVFSVLMSCMNGKIVEYRWGSDTYNQIAIADNLYSDVSFADEYVDVIEQWKDTVKSEFIAYLDQISTARYREIQSIITDKLDGDILTLTGNLNEQFNNFKDVINGYIEGFDAILKREITSMDSAIDILKARMDTFSSLPDGSTTGDAELADIKVGYNGKIYNSAGSAVREQFASIIDENHSLYANTDNLVNRHTLSIGYLKDTDGTLIVDDAYFKKYTTTDYISVIPGETYDILVPQGDAYNRIVFFTDPNTVHSHIDFGDSLTERNIVIPDEVTYIRISYLNTSPIQPAHVSVVHSGGNTMDLMRGIIDYDFVDHKVRVNESNQFRPEVICGLKNLSSNLFNKYDVVDNKFLKTDLKWLDTDVFATFFTSGYITVEPGETYTISPVWSAMYFDKYYRLVGYSEEVNHVALTIVVPENAVYVRIKALMSNKDKVMMNKGETLLPYKEFKATYGFLPDFQIKRLYTLREAMCKWSSGEPFDIGFLGDSTTDGMGTTSGGGHQSADTNAGGWGRANYVNVHAYPYKLEKLIHNAIGNNVARICNIGYSGTKFDSLIPYYDDIFGHAYSGVKMVGIAMGINDRLVSDRSKYYKNFREDLIYTVEYLCSKGIQPFMVTTQATLESHCEDEFDDTVHPLRDAESINTIANGIKKEVADEYNLEIIDLNSYDEFVINYSQIPVSDICTDKLHFKNIGHSFEAEYLYAYISGRCVDIKSGDILSYASQKLRSQYPSNRLNYFDKITNGFKVYANHDRNTNEDIVLQDFIINNTECKPVTLIANCITPNTQYVLVDDVRYDIDSEKTNLLKIDVGVHRIIAMSGNSSNVNWVGFELV
jgi:hypothetical protein